MDSTNRLPIDLPASRVDRPRHRGHVVGDFPCCRGGVLTVDQRFGDTPVGDPEILDPGGRHALRSQQGRGERLEVGGLQSVQVGDGLSGDLELRGQIRGDVQLDIYQSGRDESRVAVRSTVTPAERAARCVPQKVEPIRLQVVKHR